VEGTPRQVVEYLEGETSPFRKWLDRLKDREARGRINLRIRGIEEKGKFGKCKSVGKVHELIFDFGPGYRVYFGLDGPKVVVLLGGGDKSSQDQDIKKAHERWEDYNDG
jgi:putative addiction module killer protein